jgi:putative tryptophan/tyrosine transport system substrate-binding protein
MRLRTVAALLLLAAAQAAEAQQAGRAARIGVLVNNDGPYAHAVEAGLRELGYVEGKNIVVDRRSAGGASARLPALAAELVRRQPDVIVAPDPPSARAVRAATRTIPIVMRSSDDPVTSGLVESLARPGGNVTGVYSLYADLNPKRLELLKEALVHITRVAVLWDPTDASARRERPVLEQAARSLGLTLVSAEARAPDGLEPAMQAAMRERAEALITLRSPMLVIHRDRVVALAARHRLPAIYDEREFVEAGGLMAYGANLGDLYRHMATYVDRILKGARPADLPIERATTVELVINRQTAKALGLSMPAALLLRADRVVP